METFWFVAVALMFAAYVVLDGFDLGAGVLQPWVARGAGEKALVIRAIGPVWDGNEVWLVAAGGTLLMAFPRLYAAAFSGFYLPLMIVLWLLIGRALGIELRHQLDNPLWHALLDFVFSAASILLALFLGAALGNVLRGVPLDRDGSFFTPLWTTFRPGPVPGILDWYTLIVGVSALLILAVHGANYLAVKTAGTVQERCRRVRGALLVPVAFLTLVGLLATVKVRPDVLAGYERHFLAGLMIPLAVFASLAAMGYFHLKHDDRSAFVASGGYIVSMLCGAAFALYPAVLPASTDASLSLTVYNSSAGGAGLRTALWWWVPGMLMAAGYFTIVYRMFRGKVGGDAQA